MPPAPVTPPAPPTSLAPPAPSTPVTPPPPVTPASPVAPPAPVTPPPPPAPTPSSSAVGQSTVEIPNETNDDEQGSPDGPAPEQPVAERPVAERPVAERPVAERPEAEEAEPSAEERETSLSFTPAVDPLLTEAVDALRAAAALAEQTPSKTWSRWDSAHLEWSQAGTQHSGRTYLTTPEGVVRLEVPDGAVRALARLRAAKADPTAGAWLAAHVVVTPDSDEVTTTFEWNQRPYWNAPGLRMVPQPGETVPAEPMPTDEQWLADFKTYPRTPELTPDWLRNSTATPGAAAATLRGRLDELGYPREAILLPGEQPGPALLLEGAMEIRAVGQRFEVGVRDYGVFEPFHTAATEREACDWLWSYLSAPVPAATPVPRQDLDARSQAYRPSYAQLYSQLQAGGGAMLTTLPPGVALDRIGALDGVFLFPWATPVEMRALPPIMGQQNVRLFQLLTTRPLTVEAEIVPPWFGQPGGSLRFRLAQDGEGIRQLVQSGALLQVTVGP